MITNSVCLVLPTPVRRCWTPAIWGETRVTLNNLKGNVIKYRTPQSKRCSRAFKYTHMSGFFTTAFHPDGDVKKFISSELHGVLLKDTVERKSGVLTVDHPSGGALRDERCKWKSQY
jgi:hypothetical protein